MAKHRGMTFHLDSINLFREDLTIFKRWIYLWVCIRNRTVLKKNVWSFFYNSDELHCSTLWSPPSCLVCMSGDSIEDFTLRKLDYNSPNGSLVPLNCTKDVRTRKKKQRQNPKHFFVLGFFNVRKEKLDSFRFIWGVVDWVFFFFKVHSIP